MTKPTAMRTLLTGFLLALMNLPVLMAQTVTPPPPTGGGGGGNPDGPLDPLIPFDSTMNIAFLTVGVLFALYVMYKRKQQVKSNPS